MSVSVALVLLASGIVALAVTLVMRWRGRISVHRRVFNDLLLPNLSGDRFADRDVVMLPHPVSRYLRHCVPSDRPLAWTVDLDLVGETRAAPDAEWTRFEARHRVCPHKGFLWQVRCEGIGPITATGAEYLTQDGAGADYCLGQWLPLVRSGGDEIRRLAGERLCVDSFWLPSSVLPDRGVQWQPGDAHRATAIFPVADGGGAVNIWIDDRGSLQALSMMRWRHASDGPDYKALFGIRFQGDVRIDGYVIPRSAAAIWDYGSDAAFEFMRLSVEAARFY